MNMRTAGERIIESASEALALARKGQIQGGMVHVPDAIDVGQIRRKVAMSQGEFAEHFGVSVRTIQDWEQGRRIPSGASRAFLMVIDREPEAVHRALTAG